MGIVVEFNPDLALRPHSFIHEHNYNSEECLPKELINGQTHLFLKKGQRNYFLDGEIPLLQTTGNGNLSKPIASIVILESTHFKKDEETWTKGKYIIKEVITDDNILFNGFEKIN